MVQEVPSILESSQRFHAASKLRFTSMAVTRLRIMRRTARTAYSAWLSSMITISPPFAPGP